MTEVVKMRKSGVIVGRRGLTVDHPGVVRIDRETVWGNPHLKRERTRAEKMRCIAAYEADLHRMVELGLWSREHLAALSGKKLACWCAPEPCHGGLLAAAADAAAGPDAAWTAWRARRPT